MKELIKKLIPGFLLGWYHFLLAFFGAVLYGFPGRKLKVIGVTGTNGKTTVVNLTAAILKEAGFKTASLSSIKFKIGEKEWPNTLKMTMPGRFKLQKFLKQAVKANCQYLVLEVTSEGIKQHRHRFINFNTAVLTNLTPEHIESHGSFEKYKQAKAKLFQAAKNIHIINSDDPSAEYFLQFPAKQKLLYGSRTSVKLDLKLLGDFNYFNGLAALQVGLSQGIDLAICQRALEKAKGVPGRMETVIKEPFAVIVDYAHTPDALEKVYQAISDRKICVLGSCGGGRDKWKRKILGEIAAKYCHKVIITNEDPYDEEPMEIIKQVAESAGESAEKILDRREAIREALKLAQTGDAVIITGKGSEPWLCVRGGKKILWDDRKIVQEEFKELSS